MKVPFTKNINADDLSEEVQGLREQWPLLIPRSQVTALKNNYIVEVDHRNITVFGQIGI